MESKPQQYKDYYYILGVSPDATSEEIQEAYGELYEKYGPHVNIHGQDPDAMIKALKDISEAFETLNDPDKRKEYDQHNLPHLQKSHLRSLWGKISGLDSSKDGIPAVNAAAETRVALDITLKEAYKGCIKSVRIDEQLPCKHCTGMKPLDKLQCRYCRGTGNTYTPREEEFSIPPKVQQGVEFRLPGKGKFDTRVQRSGDLVGQVQIKQHPFFHVLGNDVTCNVPITILEAILGGEIECPTPTGKVLLKIQPLSQSGRVYRLKGLGIAGGDFLVTVEVVVPSQISADEVALFRKLKDVSTLPNPRAAIFDQLRASNQTSES